MKLLKILIVAGLLIAVPRWWYGRALSPVDAGSDRRITVTLNKGTGVSGIAETLKERGLIRSPLAFKLHVRFSKLQSQLQAGSFVLLPSQSTPDIVDVLRTGRSEEVRVTIPEGFTITQIDALLSERGLGQPGDIVACAFDCDFSEFAFLPVENAGNRREGYGSRLEGYVFPDTYFVIPETYTPHAFLARALAAFQSRIITGLGDELRASNRSLGEIINMASLIEKETRTADERPMVSGILWKRLDNGVSLGVDATVRYFTNNPTGAITRTHLDMDSPYNTRKFRGLPPGPIANPGLQSIEAALLPAHSEYWYYLHDNNGRIHYARTNDEHNANRARYLR